MRHLNYGHLQYFHAVAKHGSVVRAGEVLHLTPQTISGQLRLLEDAVGGPLFQREGRRLVLTELGQLVYRYAEEIFSIGNELAQVVRHKLAPVPTMLHVGITQTVPKLIAHHMVTPAMEAQESLRIVCVERPFEDLLSELSLHKLDVVLSDRPVPPGLAIKAYSHFLGECGTTFFQRKPTRRRKAFPACLQDARLLLPHGGGLRSQIDAWFASHQIVPRLTSEFDDSALMKVFGMQGAGVFPGPTAIEREICSMYRVSVVGRTTDVVERFYAISPERRLRHPAVLAISGNARDRIFANAEPTPQRKEAGSVADD